MPALAQTSRAAIRAGPVPAIRTRRPRDPAKWTDGERVIGFIEEFCREPDGPHVGRKMRLDVFQKLFILAVFDNPAGTLRAILSIARKNGKSSLIAAIVLAFVCGPMARRNSQIVSGAMSREQAALVFDLGQKMIGLEPRLDAVCRVVASRKQIIGLALNTEYRALSAEGSTAHGQSPILAILDEVGQINGPTSPFVDAITTSQGAHDRPLLIAISTQAKSDADLFSVWIDDAERGGDPTVVAHIYAADEGAGLLDKRQWRQANPALGKFRSEKDLRTQLRRAARLPSAEAGARNLLLNQRVALEALFLAPGVWKANAGAADLEAFRDFPVALGLDLSAVNDLTAAVLAAADDEGVVHLLPFIFTPSAGIEERALRDGAPYDAWVRDRLMIAIGGRSMDYAQVCGWLQTRLGELGIEPQVVCFDRWNMKFLKPVAEELGLAQAARWEEIGQGYRDMTPRLRSFETAMLEGRVRHGNHPVLAMAAANAIAVRDAADGRKLDKSKATQRIDPLVAAIMAAHEVLEGEKPWVFDAAAMIG